MRGLLALMLTLLCGVAAWRAVPGRGMDQFYAYHAGRGIELGSLWAGLSMVLAKWVGLAIECRYDHASKNIAAAWSAPLATVTLPLQVAAVALLAWRFHRTGGRDLMRYAAATLLAFVLLGKVLSPQYLVWLMPFVAALDGRRGRQACWLFLSAALLTTSVFPVFWAALSCFDNLALALLNARNFMLLALFCVLVREAE